MARQVSRAVGVWCVWAVVLAGAPAAMAGPYTFTKIAAAGVGEHFEVPALNNAGVVAFWSIYGGGTRIFTGAGGPLTTIAQSGAAGLAGFLTTVDVNDAGVVALTAGLAAGGGAVLTGNGGPLTTVADTSGPFSSLGIPAINAGGTVAFAAGYDSGGGDGGLYTDTGGVNTLEVAFGGPGGGVPQNYGSIGAYDLSDTGRIVFRNWKAINVTETGSSNAAWEVAAEDV